MESTRGEEVVHLEASDVRKTPARGDETPVKVPAGTKGCTVEGTLFTGKVAGEFRINLGEDKPLELAPVRVGCGLIFGGVWGGGWWRLGLYVCTNPINP